MKPFIKFNHKLQTLKNEITENLKNVHWHKNVKVIRNSINLTKKTNVITLLDNKELLLENYNYKFLDFPEWAINYTKPLIYFSFNNGYLVQNNVDNPFKASSEGTLKLNDLLLNAFELNSYWIKLDDSYSFNIRIDVNFSYISYLDLPSWSSSRLQTFLTAKLYILNENIYDKI